MSVCLHRGGTCVLQLISLFLILAKLVLAKPGYSPAVGDMARPRLMQIQSVSGADREGVSSAHCKSDLHVSADALLL